MVKQRKASKENTRHLLFNHIVVFLLNLHSDAYFDVFNSLSFENAREMYRTHALLTNDLYINFVSCSQSFVFLVLQPENIYFSNLKRNNTCL